MKEYRSLTQAIYIKSVVRRIKQRPVPDLPFVVLYR